MSLDRIDTFPWDFISCVYQLLNKWQVLKENDFIAYFDGILGARTSQNAFFLKGYE
jgi:hypothetical protein